jgi:hypothetical protein
MRSDAGMTKTEEGISTCAKGKSPPLVSPLVGWLVDLCPNF